MGSFSYSCQLTGLPITSGTPCVIIPILPSDMYKRYYHKLKKYGEPCFLSNDGAYVKYYPCMFPIKGTYDDYGGIEDIVEDDHTKLLEEHFNLPIQNIADILTSGRKDDGFDGVLRAIMDDSVEFTSFGSVKDDSKLNYKDEYKILVESSVTWLHAEIYDNIEDFIGSDDEHFSNYYYDNYVKKHIKELKDFNFDNGKSQTENLYEHVLPLVDKKAFKIGGFTRNDLIIAMNAMDELKNNIFGENLKIIFKCLGGEHEKNYDKIETLFNTKLQQPDKYKEFKSKVESALSDLVIKIADSKIPSLSHNSPEILIAELLLNGNDYYNIKSMPKVYFNAIIEKNYNLKSHVMKMKSLKYAYYAMGKYYDLIGTSFQDGEPKMVLPILTKAVEIAKKQVEDRN